MAALALPTKRGLWNCTRNAKVARENGLASPEETLP
jgi:hypothetical protein